LDLYFADECDGADAEYIVDELVCEMELESEKVFDSDDEDSDDEDEEDISAELAMLVDDNMAHDAAAAAVKSGVAPEKRCYKKRKVDVGVEYAESDAEDEDEDEGESAPESEVEDRYMDDLGE
jgi:hypothetical protein